MRRDVQVREGLREYAVGRLADEPDVPAIFQRPSRSVSGLYAAPVPTLAEVTAALDRAYDPSWAAAWDAVGLVCGDPDARIEKILFAVDPVQLTVDEALEWGADLLVTHHPLLLTGVHGVPASDPKGRLVHRLISGGCALFVAHTNADVASPGVSDALAATIGLQGTRPLEPDPTERWDKIVVFVPTANAEAVLDAMAAAGAGAFGAYDRCAWSTSGEGTFRPGAGANPAIGAVGVVERVPEVRLETVLPHGLRADVIAALRAVHPYEEPAFDVYRLERCIESTRGAGRVGRLASPMRLADLVSRVAAVLPATAGGVRATGDADAMITTVAVCGGSGGAYAEQARAAGAEAYLTADLRHHVTSEVVERSVAPAGGQPPLAMIDVAHWASEWPWLVDASDRLRTELTTDGTTVDVRVSTAVTDPWTLHVNLDRSQS